MVLINFLPRLFVWKEYRCLKIISEISYFVREKKLVIARKKKIIN